MSASTGTTRNTARFIMPDDGGWVEYAPGTVYNCDIYLSCEGSVFIAATPLAGVVGQGNTEAAALDDARRAATEAVRAHKASGRMIPWEKRELKSGEVARVVIVRP